MLSFLVFVLLKLRPSRMRSKSAPPIACALTCEKNNGGQLGRPSLALSLLQLKATRMEFFCEEEESHDEIKSFCQCWGRFEG